MEDSCEALWGQFVESGSDASVFARSAPYECWQFGVGPEQGDSLLAYVLSGSKRATSGSFWVYQHEGETVPRVGDFSVITDGAGRARLVIRTTSVSVVPFDEVDEDFAYAEGEGDRSLEYWRKVHWDCFTQGLSAVGRLAEPDMPVVCERFDVVFPSEHVPKA